MGLFVTWPRESGVARLAETEVAAADSGPSAADVRILSNDVGDARDTTQPSTKTPTSRMARNTEAARLVKAEAARISAENAARNAPFDGVSQSRTRHMHCVQKGQARKDGAIEGATQEANAEDCQQRCRCLEGCDFFTFWTDGQCHVQTKDSMPFSAPLAVSGPPSCEHDAREDLPPSIDLPQVKPQPDGFVGPKVYVYQLPGRFRNWGQETSCGWEPDCIFGGPPVRVHGVDIWASSQFHMPLMLYYRFLHYPWLTRNVDDADVFIIPAYNLRPSPELPCANNSDLFETLYQLNPKLKDDAWAASKAPRHLLMDARGWETCRYMWELSMPFRLAHRINIELNGLMEDGPEGWTYNKPFVWYQFPYPAVYHGPALSTPAKLRLARLAASSPSSPSSPWSRYLWSFSGTGRGLAGHLRSLLIKECTKCNRCGKVTQVSEVTGSVQQQKDRVAEYARLSAIKLQSVFCAEPPGDSVTRKSLIDSIVLGCIPVIFVHQELDMFEAFATAEEFAEAVVFVPEAELMGPEGAISLWGKGTFHEHSAQWRKLKRLYPQRAEVFEALRPQQSAETREKRLRALFPKPKSITSVLASISEEEIQAKQRALAKISHRFVIGLDDSSEDALRILLNRIVSNDKLVAKRNRQSTLS